MTLQAMPPRTYGRYMEYFGERKLARFYPWILSGLVILYVATYPVLESPILVVVPAVVAGWFYYRWGGLAAGLLAILLNVNLIQASRQILNWPAVFDFSNSLLVGHILVVIGSFGSGYLREIVERQYQIDTQLRRRERHITLVNLATREILEGANLNDIYYRLLTHLTNVLTGDHACLVIYDEQSRGPVLAAATREAQPSIHNTPLGPEEASIARSVLDSERIVFIDDVDRSSQPEAALAFKALWPSTRAAVLIPLMAREYKFGIVTVAFDTPQHFDREEISYMELTSKQITLALRSIHQEGTIAKKLLETEILARIELALVESEQTGVDTVLQLIVDAAKDMIPNTQRVVLHLLDQERNLLIPRAVTGYKEASTARLNMLFGEGIAGRVIATGEVANISDIRTDPRFKTQDMPVTFRSMIVVPIHSKERRIGTISVHSNKVGVFSSEETNLLSALGARVAIAIENANLLETTQQDFKEISALYHLTRSLTESLDPDQLMTDAVEFLENVFGYYHIQIYILDRKLGRLVARYGAGAIGNQLGKEQYSLVIGAGTIGHVAETGQPFFTNNVDEVVFFVRNPLLPQTRSEMVLPIRINNQVWGVLNIQETSFHPITQRQLQLMEAVTQQLAVAWNRANLYAELQSALDQEQATRAQLIRSERLAVAGRLLASVSHELNNPLQAIQNALFLLKDEEQLSAQGRQDMDIILSETERMASLLGRLRDTYRSTLASELHPVDLNALVEDVLALIATYMRHRKIAFEFFPEPDLPPVSGIAEQIRQVLLNLFMNGIEAMREGGKLTICTSSGSEAGHVLLSIEDTGTGILPDLLPRIFDPFITTKETGTGLGLTISRDIIHQHHGTIEAQNNPEGGAMFKIWLPMTIEDGKNGNNRSHPSD